MKTSKDSRDKLIEIARECAKNKNVEYGEDAHTADRVKFDPDGFGDFPRTEKALLDLLGWKWKVCLGNAVAFFNHFKEVTSNYLKPGKRRPVSVLEIASTSKPLGAIFGGQRNVSRVLRVIQKIKGLVVADEYFRYTGNRRQRRGIFYAYNKEVEKLVLATKERYPDVEVPKAAEQEVAAPAKTAAAQNYLNARVTNKPGPITNCTEKDVLAMLERRYGEIVGPRRVKIAEMNKALPDEQKIKMDWNVDFKTSHRLGRARPQRVVKSIGIRATSRIVSFKSRENGNDDYNGRWRKDYLDQVFGKGMWEEYDVSGSVYRITKLLNKGEWDEPEVDPYREMFGRDFRKPGDRDAFKLFCMSLKFDDPKMIRAHKALKMPKCRAKMGKKEMQNVIDEAVGRMEAYTGQRMGSEVFLWESLLYVDFAYWLRKGMGLEMVQVYDGFYLRKGQMDRGCLDRKMKELALAFLEEYRGWRNREQEMDGKVMRRRGKEVNLGRMGGGGMRWRRRTWEGIIGNGERRTRGRTWGGEHGE